MTEPIDNLLEELRAVIRKILIFVDNIPFLFSI